MSRQPDPKILAGKIKQGSREVAFARWAIEVEELPAPRTAEIYQEMVSSAAGWQQSILAGFGQKVGSGIERKLEMRICARPGRGGRPPKLRIYFAGQSTSESLEPELLREDARKLREIWLGFGHSGVRIATVVPWLPGQDAANDHPGLQETRALLEEADDPVKKKMLREECEWLGFLSIPGDWQRVRVERTPEQADVIGPKGPEAIPVFPPFAGPANSLHLLMRSMASLESPCVLSVEIAPGALSRADRTKYEETLIGLEAQSKERTWRNPVTERWTKIIRDNLQSLRNAFLLKVECASQDEWTAAQAGAACAGLLGGQEMANVEVRRAENGKFPAVETVGRLVGLTDAARLLNLPIDPDGPVAGYEREQPDMPLALAKSVDSPDVTVGPTLRELTGHTVICGVPGSGKTTTVFKLLQEVSERGIPFLAIEPAKREYRNLAAVKDWPGKPVSVWTLGNELLAPLRLNPLQLPPHTSVQRHVSALLDVFSAAFQITDEGWFAPLMTEALFGCYSEAGLSPVDSLEQFEEGDEDRRWPTLSDLYRQAMVRSKSAGYGKEVQANIEAALGVRLRGLLIGTVGALLDCEESSDLDQLLDGPAVLELEEVGSDDDRALVMGLLIVHLRAHIEARQRRDPASGGLRHVMVIEEAHRLLAHTEGANSQSQAVQSLCNMIAELRASGEGIILSEQIPSLLARQAIYNTSTRVIHALTSAEEREVLVADVAGRDDEVDQVARFRSGEALVFSRSLGRPVQSMVIEGVNTRATLSDEELLTYTADDVEKQTRKLLPVRACRTGACLKAGVCDPRIREKSKGEVWRVAGTRAEGGSEPVMRLSWLDEIADAVGRAVPKEKGGQALQCAGVQLNRHLIRNDRLTATELRELASEAGESDEGAQERPGVKGKGTEKAAKK